MSDGSNRRILTKRRGLLQPLIPRPPLLSSSERAGWHGIVLEKHMAEANYVATNFDVYSHLVHIFAGIPVSHEWRADGRQIRFQATAGSLLVEPQGMHASVRAVRSSPDIQWILEFDAAVIAQRMQERLNGKPLDLAPQFDLRDAQVSRMVQSLQSDVEAGSPAGSLFGEMIGDALAAYLASPRAAADSKVGGLPKMRLSRVLEFIHANLDRNIHLEELAGAASMSAFHFAKMFKLSTGNSPHQYILERRLERAKQLLRDPVISLSQVSLLSGFADQSHLTNVFRRCVGVTPYKFRSQS